MKNPTKTSARNFGLISHTTARPVERNVIDVHIHTPKIKIQATQLARQNANPIITTELCPPPNTNLKDLLEAT